MGNEASTYDDPEDKFDGIDTLGYRVLGVQPNSPASSAGLVSFFDFLVGCNGRMLLGRSIDEEGKSPRFTAGTTFLGSALAMILFRRCSS